MAYLSLEERMIEFGDSTERVRNTLKAKIFNKKNLKYLGAEVPGFVIGNIFATGVSISLYKAGAPPLVNAALTAIADSVGFYLGNAITYTLENLRQYREGTRNWKDDMNKLAVSNLESAIIGVIIKTAACYFANKYDVFPYYWRSLLATSIASIIPSAVRHTQNYKFGFIGINGKKTE